VKAAQFKHKIKYNRHRVQVKLSESFAPLNRHKEESHLSNNIICITIIKPFNPINARVLYQACSVYGKVLRIAVYRYRYITAFVEYENEKIALNAKRDMNGMDLYENCCTLKVEFASVSLILSIASIFIIF
jgi:hypothetical protein